MNIRFILLAALGVLAGLSIAQAQDPLAGLQIASPATGTAVHPGDQISVDVHTIQVASNPPQQVFLMAEGMGISDIHSAPFQFTFQIPQTTLPGEYNLYAAGQGPNAPGISYISNPITLLVLRTNVPSRIVVEPSMLFFQIPPASDLSAYATPFRMYFEYADGTRSPVLPLSPGAVPINIQVGYGNVHVDNTGLVTPLYPGFDQIQITCLACNYSSVPPVSVFVQQLPIYVAQKSMMVSAAGGTLQMSVTTNRATYSVSGESWARAANSASTDQIHWTTTVTVDPNRTRSLRTGTLRLSLATGETQDVVIYQPGSN
jgi:hypothetical protein